VQAQKIEKQGGGQGSARFGVGNQTSEIG